MNSVNGRTFAIADSGHPRAETGKRASEKTIKSPATYVGSAHSNFVANNAYALSRSPRPRAAKMFTSIARKSRLTDNGFTIKGIFVWKTDDKT